MVLSVRCYEQGLGDLSKVYLPELLERVSAGVVLEAVINLSICINFTVFSFVMAYNTKNIVGLLVCNLTFCVSNRHLFSSNSLYLKIFGFIRYDFRCVGDKDLLVCHIHSILKFIKRTITTDTTIYYTR